MPSSPLAPRVAPRGLTNAGRSTSLKPPDASRDQAIGVGHLSAFARSASARSRRGLPEANVRIRVLPRAPTDIPSHMNSPGYRVSTSFLALIRTLRGFWGSDISTDTVRVSGPVRLTVPSFCSLSSPKSR